MSAIQPEPPSDRPSRARSAKRATNLSLSADVLDAARELRLNVSHLCDQYLREAVRREQDRRWREEHVSFIEAYNATLETEGLPLEQWRTF